MTYFKHNIQVRQWKENIARYFFIYFSAHCKGKMGILKNSNARNKWNQYTEAVQPLFSLKLSLYGQEPFPAKRTGLILPHLHTTTTNSQNLLQSP